MPPSLSLRPTTMDDAGILLDWVNQPDSLAHKLKTTMPIEADQHSAWLAHALESETCLLWILETEGRPVGQVRFQKTDGPRWSVDIFIDAACRGSGAAHFAIRTAADLLAMREPSAILQADVKAVNQASLKLFGRLGFKLEQAGPDYSTFFARIGDIK